MPELRRGAAAIEAAANNKGGAFSPFVPRVDWRDDKEEKYVLFLTPIAQIPTVELYDWIEVGEGEKANGETYKRYEQFISRKDPAIGESTDDLQDRLGQTPKVRSIAIAVELEAISETVKGRPRATGFKVATDTYERQTDDGTIEVTQPKIGLVVQSAQNFFGWLSSYDSTQGPIEETAMNVIRRGKDANTTYDFIAMEGRPIDLSPLMDNIDGVSYLSEDMDDLMSAIEGAESFEEAAQTIATLLLDRRLDELQDKDRYDELVSPITEITSRFGEKKKKGAARPPRPSRREPRREPESDSDEAASHSNPESDAPTTRTDRFAALRAKVEAKNKSAA